MGLGHFCFLGAVCAKSW